MHVMRGRAALCVAALWLVPAKVFAQDLTCGDCAACTAALARPNARVGLSGDIVHTGRGVCVTVAGEGAQLNGHEHTIRGTSGTGVRITAQGATARNVTLDGLAAGVEVAADRVTLFHVRTRVTEVGVSVVGRDVHLVRMDVRGGRVGVGYGAVTDGRCAAGAALRSPGAVLRGSTITGATVGVASCEAYALLSDNTVTGGDVGVALGSPVSTGVSGPAASGPYDDCVCAPSLDRVLPTTTLMFSSGCGGCLVHEGWLPALRASRRDIRAREAGPTNLALQQRFDAFLDRCAPELTDVLGIPGCVPNYACPANSTAAKVRTGEGDFALETRVSSQEDVGRMADVCAAEGARRYRAGASCARYQLIANRLCGNRSADLRGGTDSLRLPGLSNACARADGVDTARAGCTAECGSPAGRAPQAPPTQAPEVPTEVAPTEVPPTVPDARRPVTAPTPSAPSAPEESGGSGVVWAMALAMTGIVAAGLRNALKKR